MKDKIPITALDCELVFSPDALPVLSACQNEAYLIQAACVVQKRERDVVLKAQTPTKCKACASMGGCSLGLLGRWALRRQHRLVIPVQTLNTALTEGCWIWIGLPKKTFLSSVFVLYFLPVLCFLVGGALGGYLLPETWGVDFRTAMGMLLGGCIGLYLARIGARYVARHSANAGGVSILWPAIQNIKTTE